MFVGVWEEEGGGEGGGCSLLEVSRSCLPLDGNRGAHVRVLSPRAWRSEQQRPKSVLCRESRTVANLSKTCTER